MIEIIGTLNRGGASCPKNSCDLTLRKYKGEIQISIPFNLRDEAILKG
jgi:hypothetical protein